MPIYTHQAMDKITGMQQGLETSIMEHKDELSVKFGRRLEHGCREAEDAAFHRAQVAIEPQLQALGEQLQAHVQQTHACQDRLSKALAEAATRQDTADQRIAELTTQARLATARLDNLTSQLGQEAQKRVAACLELDQRILEANSAIAEEGRSREESVHTLQDLIQGEADRVDAATRELAECTEQQFKRTAEEVASVEARVMQCLKDQVRECLRESTSRLADTAACIHEEMRQAAAHTDAEMGKTRALARVLVEETAAALRDLQAGASQRTLAAAEQSLEQQAARLSAEQQHGLERASQDSERAIREASAPIWEALASLEGRLADAKSTHASELQTLANGETLRVTFLNALSVPAAAGGQGGHSGHGCQGAQLGAATGRRPRVVDSELLKTNTHARRALEAGLHDDVGAIQTALADVEERFCQQLDKLREEVRARATSHEVYTRLEAATSDVKARCSSAHNEASETRKRSQQEILALGNEITTLRAAATSLANGVLRALQVIGLFEGSGTREQTDAGNRTPRMSEEAPHVGGCTGVRGGSDAKVRIDDLLQWDRAGNSLADRIARLWQRREAMGVPSILVALDRALATDPSSTRDHGHISLAPLGRPDLTVPPLPPAFPKGAPPPAAVANVRLQKILNPAGPPYQP